MVVLFKLKQRLLEMIISQVNTVHNILYSNLLCCVYMLCMCIIVGVYVCMCACACMLMLAHACVQCVLRVLCACTLCVCCIVCFVCLLVCVMCQYVSQSVCVHVQGSTFTPFKQSYMQEKVVWTQNLSTFTKIILSTQSLLI